MSGVNMGRWKKSQRKCYKFSTIVVYLYVLKSNINYIMKLRLEN